MSARSVGPRKTILELSASCTITSTCGRAASSAMAKAFEAPASPTNVRTPDAPWAGADAVGKPVSTRGSNSRNESRIGPISKWGTRRQRPHALRFCRQMYQVAADALCRTARSPACRGLPPRVGPALRVQREVEQRVVYDRHQRVPHLLRFDRNGQSPRSEAIAPHEAILVGAVCGLDSFQTCFGGGDPLDNTGSGGSRANCL